MHPTITQSFSPSPYCTVINEKEVVGRQQPTSPPNPFLGRGCKAAAMLADFQVSRLLFGSTSQRHRWDYRRKKVLALSWFFLPFTLPAADLGGIEKQCGVCS